MREHKIFIEGYLYTFYTLHCIHDNDIAFLQHSEGRNFVFSTTMLNISGQSSTYPDAAVMNLDDNSYSICWN